MKQLGIWKVRYSTTMVKCCKATNACCCLKYVMCTLQFILVLLYFLIENIFTVITFILSLSCFYYKLRWRLYTRLEILDSSNPLQRNIKTKSGPKSPKTPKTPNTPNVTDTRNKSPKYSNSIPDNDDDDNNIEMANMAKKRTDTQDADYEVKYATDTQDDIIDIEYHETEYKNIRILTQNLWVHFLAPSPCKRQRIKAFIQFLSETQNNYDILIIQEIFGLRFGAWIRCNDLEYLVCELYKLGYIYYTKPSGVLPYIGQNGGIVLFSKYPLIYDDVFKFNKSDEIMLRKGFAIAIAKIPISNNDNDNNNNDEYYHLCIGTCHCDPYRPNVILSQIKQFSKEIKSQYDNHKTKLHLDIIVGGDFNTRNKTLTKGLKDYFEDIISMYNAWTIKTNDRQQWNKDLVTYRSSYIPKYRVWLSGLTCGLFKLPSLNKMTGKYKNGYCLDHILTSIKKEMIESVSVVDSRYKDVFVSDHLGVELVVKVQIINDNHD
eukprot:33245_1